MIVNSLTDRFGRQHSYLRISLTDRCNLRCTYCLPAQGIDWTPKPNILTTEEILRLGAIFVGMGIRKIRLTGGEPLLCASIDKIVMGLRGLSGLDILAMTTNGIGLQRWATPLRLAGLDSLTVSLDTLHPARFAAIARRDRLSDVLIGIKLALEAGFSPLKLNIVILRGVNDDEVLDFLKWGRDLPVNLRFIEYMPFPGNQWSTAKLVPFAEIQNQLSKHYALKPLTHDDTDVAKYFALEGYTATISFITSMTESFCATCNRLHLTADGNIKACLFDSHELSLRDILRRGGSDNDVREVIQRALAAKAEAHAPLEQLASVENRSMVAIGG